MYQNGEKYNFAFQSIVQKTMLEGHLMKTDRKVKLMERSIHSTREIFVKHQVKFNKIKNEEANVLEEWYKFLTTNNAFNTEVDLYVYLRTDPEVSFERVEKRNREEEMCVPIEYVRQLHFLHEEWLGDASQDRSTPVLIINANKTEKEIGEMITKLDDVITGYKKMF